MPEETSAGAIVYYIESGKIYYLLLHYEEGHWDFPKGHVEKDERLEQAAIRETKEETGIGISLLLGFRETYSYFYRGKTGAVMNKTVYFFLAGSPTKEVALSHEHIGYAWHTFENAMDKLTYENAREVLKKANRYLLQKRLNDFS